MAADFTKAEWGKINAALDADPALYGLPERRDGSVVLASFNIRNLADPAKRSPGALDFLARTCARFDLVAVQEVLENMDGIERLRAEVSAHAGVEYDIIASDCTGGMGATGSAVERLAFLYRTDRVKRTAIAADISFDRTWIFETMYAARFVFRDAVKAYSADVKAYDERYAIREAAAKAAGKRRPSYSPPPFVSPQFVDFIRTPHMASFEIKGKNGAEPYRFSAINAHLLYGDASKQAEERRREFEALIEWLLQRAAQRASYNQDFILFGDLNLAFDDPTVQRPEIINKIKGFNDTLKKAKAATVVNFPFIDPRLNPRTGRVAPIRSNARESETFDQIGIFAHDKRLPSFEANEKVHEGGPDAYDYQVFDFLNLFCIALKGKSYQELSKSQRSAMVRRFEHDVSDHLPIWVRLPLPV